MRHNEHPSNINNAAGSRPLQKIRDFLTAEIDAAGDTPRRLPTIRDIAARLEVSARTVQKAFHEFAQQGRIQSVTGRGSFTVPPPKEPAFSHLRIGLNIELNHYDSVNAWAYTIHGSILQAAIASGHNAVFTNVEEELHRRERAAVDGFIILPDGAEVRERLRPEWPAAPAVFLNPPMVAATANFVSPDYNKLGFLLGDTWRKCGKERIAFVHHPCLANSPSGQLFLSGLISGLAASSRKQHWLQTIPAADISAEAGYQAVRPLVTSGQKMPDAIFCKGDFLALGALRALREAGCDVPGEVSVVGGSGLDLSETDSPQMTRCRQPFQQLGEALFHMLLMRLEQQGAPQPGRFFPAPLIGGATTTPAENELLFELEPSRAALAGANFK